MFFKGALLVLEYTVKIQPNSDVVTKVFAEPCYTGVFFTLIRIVVLEAFLGLKDTVINQPKSDVLTMASVEPYYTGVF